MRHDTWSVYVHINKINGKKYIGVTSKSDPRRRWMKGNGYKDNPHFYNAVQKYGWDGFYHIVIFNGLDECEAKDIEMYLIKAWNTKNDTHGYNMTDGGDGTKGCKPSELTRQKLSESRKKENLSEETLAKRSKSLKERKLSDMHKLKIGIGNSKKILMYSKDHKFIREFNSAKEAECELGISHSHISQCCNGKRQSSGGYCWKFA